MKKTYTVVIIIALFTGILLLFLPEKSNEDEIDADQMLTEILDNTRFISVDELADLLITKDPSVLLIDVRNPYEYSEYTLPGSLNIPLDSILNKNYEYILNQDIKKNVFFSNGTIYANQAWMLTRRLGYEGNYILKGGLNEWFDKIITPDKPETTASQEEINLYQFRLSARQYFTGGGAIIETEDATIEIPVIRKDKGTSKTGGC